MLVSLQLLHLHTSAATTASDTGMAAFGPSSEGSKFAAASGAQGTGVILGAQLPCLETSPIAQDSSAHTPASVEHFAAVV